MLPLASVILPVYNQEKYLEETIESILHQSFQDFELIILDDGSTDHSAQIIRQYAKKDSRIRAYFQDNEGKSLATNTLVNKAGGEWCFFLDADDVMLPERLERQVAFHRANPLVNASSSHCYYINEKGNSFGTQRYPGLSTIAEYKLEIASGEFITCAYTGLMVSRKVFIETGGLRKKFEPCEDFEFFNRLAEQGFILLIIPEVLMKYRIHAGSITVRNPFRVLDTIIYVCHCIRLRRTGKPEISFEQFMTLREGDSWWTKLNRLRFNYSMVLFRNAGIAILSKRYLSFVLQITGSLVLSPGYVLKKLRGHLKK
ncbi:MAG: glycosyltransferase [Ferruginibacter sp.]|nr:glycosyltransferase [Ferruginibacter sp.]